MVIEKYRNAISGPSRLSACPPLIRDAGRAAQRVRHVVIDEAGTSRERMPMGVILFSYFIRAGGVRSYSILDILDHSCPSTSSAGPTPLRPAPGRPAVRRRPRKPGRN